MFHMLTCFDLKPGHPLPAFQQALDDYTAHMKRLDLVADNSPVWIRERDTILDTDDEREQTYFMITYFRDKAQADRSVEHIASHVEPAATIHKRLYGMAENMIFISFRDLSA